MRTVIARTLVAAALAAAALIAVAGSLTGPPRWTPDALFYQARVYEIREGLSRPEALQKAFGGPLGARLRAIDPDRSGSRQWVAYNARFYERRLAVPYVASAIEPVAGDRALLDVSLAGHVAAVLAIFWLLVAARIPLGVAGAVAGLTAFLPALTHHAQFPLTDSWGLALEAGALATALIALRRGTRWLIPWTALIALLALTRDSAWIPVLAGVALALIQRSRLTLWLAGTGVAAALAAMIAVPVSMRELLAQMFNDAQPAPDASWGTVLSQYPGAVADWLQADGGFVRDGAWFSALYLLAGLALLLVLGRRNLRDSTTIVAIAATLAGAAYMAAVPIFSAFRIELVLVPMAALGLALGVQRVLAGARARGVDGTPIGGVFGRVGEAPDPPARRQPDRWSRPVPGVGLRDVGSDG